MITWTKSWRTSTLLFMVLMNLWPGMRFWLQITPTSSLCRQSDTPKPFEGHSAKDFSLPVQWTLSSQMRPVEQRTIVGFVNHQQMLCFGCHVGITTRLLNSLKGTVQLTKCTLLLYLIYFKTCMKMSFWRIFLISTIKVLCFKCSERQTGRQTKII